MFSERGTIEVQRISLTDHFHPANIRYWILLSSGRSEIPEVKNLVIRLSRNETKADHISLGECPCFIRTQNRHTSQCFNTCEVFNQDVTSGHSSRNNCKRERDTHG